MIAKNLFVRFFLLAVTMAFLSPFGLSSQVTIGSLNPPSQFSLLDLDASEQQRALHNARLDSVQRNALASTGSSLERQDSARGLLLYNTDTNCLEFWNGSQWISLCAGDVVNPCAGLDNFDAVFCPGETVADLTARARAYGGRGLIRWYDAEIGGNRFDNPNELLTARTYWANNCYGIAERIPVPVTLVNCTSIDPLNGRITTFTNVMYDFQHQTLEAFTIGAGQATSWQWQVSSDNVNWYDIPGASSSPTFMIPADFMYNVAGISSLAMEKGEGVQNSLAVDNHRILHFRCLMSNANTPTPAITQDFDIYFIRTNTSGFGKDANGVRYLVLNRAPHMGTGPDTIRMALLSIGQSGTGSWLNGVHQPEDITRFNDAGDLGDLFQWGRIADGHQYIVWDKNRGSSSRPNMFGSGTSSFVARGPNAPAVDANGQVTDPAFVGRFITAPADPGDWGTAELGTVANPVNRDLWGNNLALSRENSPTSLDEWADRARANNPCPPGWRVPSRFEFGDMHLTNGTDTPSVVLNPIPPTSGDNGTTWEWRAFSTQPNGTTSIGAVGGMILTNDFTGESVFIPNMGTRSPTGAGPSGPSGIVGEYWSSTTTSNILGNASWFLQVSTSYGLRAGNGTTNRARGMGIRCVQ